MNTYVDPKSAGWVLAARHLLSHLLGKLLGVEAAVGFGQIKAAQSTILFFW